MSRDRTAYRAQAVVPPCRLGIDEQTYLKGDVWGEPLSRPMSPSGTGETLQQVKARSNHRLGPRVRDTILTSEVPSDRTGPRWSTLR